MNKIVAISSILFLTSFSYAKNCSYNEYNQIKVDALNQFSASKEFYNNAQYDKAYDSLLKSIRTYPKSDTTLSVINNCIQIKPGPFGALRTPYDETNEYAFDRLDFKKELGKYIPPRPLVIVQHYENSKSKLIATAQTSKKLKVKITVVNVLKTKLNKNTGSQMSLEDFKIDYNKETLDFGLLKSEESKTIEIGTIDNNKKFAIKSQEATIYNISKF